MMRGWTGWDNRLTPDGGARTTDKQITYIIIDSTTFHVSISKSNEEYNYQVVVCKTVGIHYW